MHVANYESSIHALCQRLDALLQSIVAEIELHQSRIQRLREQSEDYTGGDEVKGAVMTSAIVLLQAVEGLESQLAGVRELIDEQQRLLADLHLESRTDVLTGLINRRAFDEELARRTAQARRGDKPLGVLMIDIDRFKLFNDEHGHEAGDKVLRGVANLLTNSFREMDIVARYGGEEFAAILPDTNLESACLAAERARAAVAAGAVTFNDRQLSVTISIGIALVEDDADDALRRADEALYAAKRAGRDRAFIAQDDHCQPLA